MVVFKYSRFNLLTDLQVFKINALTIQKGSVGTKKNYLDQELTSILFFILGWFF